MFGKHNLVTLLLLTSLCSFAKTWTIKNSGAVFSPSTLTITQGDTVIFSLTSSHNSDEVSQSTWNSNGNTQLSGGWSLPFGGGTLLTTQLTIGTHYYVCTPHAFFGMKGTITVQGATGINENQLTSGTTLFPNPATDNFSIKTSCKSLITYNITDIFGKQILSGNLTSDLTTIDISQFSFGVYLVTLQTEDYKQVFRLVKSN